MTKISGRKTFRANINGNEYKFDCWTTSTRTGFCHHAECPMLNISARNGYMNRPYESFCYETVLWSCINKLKRKSDMELRDELIAEVIDAEKKREEERCNAMFGKFESAWNGASEETKQRVRGMVGENGITNEEQASAVTATLQLFNVIG